MQMSICNFLSRAFALAANIFVLHGYILRLPCLTYGKFTIIKNDAALQGYVLTTFLSTDAKTCELECLQNKRCKSINTHDDNETCELNGESTEEWASSAVLTPAIGWTYKSTDYNAMQVNALSSLQDAR